MTKQKYQQKIKVIVVEDDVSVAKTIQYNLVKEGFDVNIVADSDGLMSYVKVIQPDIILIDWVLPGIPGTAICSMLRKDRDTANIPIIMISARKDDIDKVIGFEHGADDYITKPISQPELIARIKAILRRSRPVLVDKRIEYLDLLMDLNSFDVFRNGHLIKLPPTEFQILQLFMEYPRKVFTRSKLIERVWGDDPNVNENTITVHITRLRKNLSLFGRDLIQTVRNVGYKLE